MSFADPQSITISGVTTSLPRTATGQDRSSYTSNDGLISLLASSAYGRRTRRTLRLNHSKIAADPLLSGVNKSYSMSAYFVVDVPPLVGYTNAEQLAIITGLVTAMSASSYALTTKLLGGES